MMKRGIKISYFALIVSFINLILYYFPFYRFAVENVDIKSFNGIFVLFGLAVLILIINAMVFYILLFISRYLGKFILVVTVNLNAIAVYFINTYGVIIDITMIGNVINTNYEEASSFASFGLVLYLIFLGIIPSFFIIKIKTIRVNYKRFLMHIAGILVFLLFFIYANSSNALWIDKHSKTLGGLSMPWSYIANTYRFYHFKSLENKKQILLPNASTKDNEKSIAVLVIGESARSQNFSLYGYEKNTNPLLSKISNLYSFKAIASATYTTEAVKRMLVHSESNELYEILPNYLYRNGIEVVWRSANWGEPTVNIKNYQTRADLEKYCQGDGCEYDELLLNGLKEQILQSDNYKILIILHTSTSHGPSYYKKYPPQFNHFTPICKSVELENCTQEELINAYDNTIVYTDYILSSLIEILKQLDDYKSTMLYVSDHGESLGEKNLYMHGIPLSLAPKEQLDIPFIVWLSDNSRKIKELELLGHHHVFHSILDFLSIESPIYDQEKSIFEQIKNDKSGD